MKTLCGGIAASILVLVSVSTSDAAVVAAISNLVGGTTQPSIANATWGYEFKVYGSGVSVSELGVWDFNDDGLTEAHVVAVWDQSQTLLGQTTLTTGGGTLIDHFRYNSVTPFVLTGSVDGTAYRIGAYYNVNNGNSDVILRNVTSLTDTAEIDYLAGYWTNSYSGGAPGIIYPSTPSTEGISYFGPNFRYTALPPGVGGGGAVPEPSTLVMFGVGTIGLMIAARKRRR